MNSVNFLIRKTTLTLTSFLLISLLSAWHSPEMQSAASIADDFKFYTQKLSETQLTFDMVPVQGGEFMMGSPETEKGRKPDEGPQHKVKIDPFWMGKHETTWDLYELFVYGGGDAPMTKQGKTVKVSGLVDAVTHPTPPYTEMSFGMGKVGFPAVNMTQYAALQYCKWLTAKTGFFHRLPTEAEWEYACRAGTNATYSFGDDPAKLGEYAWFFDNSNNKYQKIGTKKPNPWGLHDMHGNVAEWTYDQYLPDAYAKAGQSAVANPVIKPTKLYPHAVRGGSWDDDADRLRSAARRPPTRNGSSVTADSRSDWWLTDASFVGFRVVRPLKQPSKEEIAQYWLQAIKDI